MTWLLERVTEVATGECQELSRSALGNAKSINEDFALLRPILAALLAIPSDAPSQQSFSGMSRASSAPVPTKDVEPDPPEARPSYSWPWPATCTPISLRTLRHDGKSLKDMHSLLCTQRKPFMAVICHGRSVMANAGALVRDAAQLQVQRVRAGGGGPG